MAHSRICLVLVMLAGSQYRVLTGALSAEPTIEAITSSSSQSSSSSSGTTFQTDPLLASSFGTANITSAASVMLTATGRISAVGEISTESVTAIYTSTSATGTQLPLSTDMSAAPSDVAGSSRQQTPESPASLTAVRALSTATSTTALGAPKDTQQTPAADGTGWRSSAATGGTSAANGSSTGRSSSGAEVRGNTTIITATGSAPGIASVTTAMPGSEGAGGWMMLVFIILALLLAAAAIISSMFMLFRCIDGHSHRAAKRRQTANSVGNSHEHFRNQPAEGHGLSSLVAAQAFYIGPGALDDESLDIGCSDNDGKRSSAPPPYNQLSAHPNSIACLNSNAAPAVDYWQQMSTFHQSAFSASGNGSTFPGFKDDGIRNISNRDSEDGIARTAL